MIITVENRYGETLKTLACSRMEQIENYSNICDEVFNIKIDQKKISSEACISPTLLQEKLVGEVNKLFEVNGSNIKIKGLTDIRKEMIDYFIDYSLTALISIVEDYEEFLCSKGSFDKQEVIDSIVEEVTSLDFINVDDISLDYEKDINIDYIKEQETKIMGIVNKYCADMINTLETEKAKIVNKNIKKEEKVKEEKKETTRHYDNFVNANVVENVEENKPLDVDYESVENQSILSKQDKMELKSKIDECLKYYYNTDRVTMMIGGDVNKVTEVMNNILVITDKMNYIINNPEPGDDKGSLLAKLSELQLSISEMISRYNPNINIGNIIKSFKAVDVAQNGEPIVVEDYFGTRYTVDHIANNNAMEQNNYKLYSKYPDLYNIIIPIQQQTGSFIKLEEIKSNYKYMSPIIKASVMMGNSDVSRYFYIDLDGTMYNDKSKFIILNNSDVIDEGYYLPISRIDLVVKYIFGSITEEELKSNNIISVDMRSLNTVIDLSSVSKDKKEFVSNILLQQISKELLMRAIKFDKVCRFRVDKITNNSFTLISDSKTKKYFNGPSCRRKKQVLTFNNGELILDGKQD